jgi:hypothetical protein
MNVSKNKALPKTGEQKIKRNPNMEKYNLSKNKKKINCKLVFKKITPFADIFPIIRFAKTLGVPEIITKYLKIKKRTRGHSKSDFVLTCVYNLLFLLGGNCIDDSEKLLKDETFKKISRVSSTQGESFREFGIDKIWL